MHFLVGIGSWTHENSSFGANNQQNSTGSKNIVRCLSWEPQSQIPSNPIEFIKKMMQKKVFIVTGSNLGNVQTFEAGRKRILDQNWCCLDSNACTSEGIDRIDPKTFFCITNFHKKIRAHALSPWVGVCPPVVGCDFGFSKAKIRFGAKTFYFFIFFYKKMYGYQVRKQTRKAYLGIFLATQPAFFRYCFPYIFFTPPIFFRPLRGDC